MMMQIAFITKNKVNLTLTSFYESAIQIELRYLYSHVQGISWLWGLYYNSSEQEIIPLVSHNLEVVMIIYFYLTILLLYRTRLRPH